MSSFLILCAMSSIQCQNVSSPLGTVRLLAVVIEPLTPRKAPRKPHPKVEQFKRELDKMVVESIAELESQLENLRERNGDKETIKLYVEHLEKLRRFRCKLDAKPEPTRR